MTQLQIVTADITTLEVDAIVNAANAALAPGGGVCGAIHRAAGPELAEACRDLRGCAVGDAKITQGYALSAKHVIHTVGPVYEGGGRGKAQMLASCYRRCLEVAHEKGLTSIAFPCISTEIFGYPAREAASIAIQATTAWLTSGREPSGIICCCFAEPDAAIYRKTLAESLGPKTPAVPTEVGTAEEEKEERRKEQSKEGQV